jgi:Uncharacterized conserved protein
MSHKAYLCGYYGMQNSGDDALLASTVWGAQKFYRYSDFVVSTPQPLHIDGAGSFSATLKAQQRFRGQNRLLQYGKSVGCNRIFFGGGSVLHNEHDIGIKRDLIKLSGRRKAIGVGIGIGPFKNNKAEIACAKLLNECAFVGVRDWHSYDIASTIAPSANVKLTFDLAPLLKMSKKIQPAQRAREGIAISLCPKERLSGLNEERETQRLKSLAAALSKVYRQTGKRFTFLDFNGHETLGDKAIHKELIALLPKNAVAEHISYNPNPHNVLANLGRFELVLGMRLHAAILAFLAESPVFSLNYHSKCNGWCEQVGIPKAYQFDAENIDPECLSETMLHALDQGFETPELTVPQAVNMAMSNWSNVNES